MKKLLSTRYSAGAFNGATLLLRLGFGVLMAYAGYQKLVNFGTMKNNFMDFMGLGSTVSLSLVVFAEFFCSILLILGLFTRFACIPLIITMCVVVFKVNHGEILGMTSAGFPAGYPFLFLIGFLTLLIIGPGKVSVDGMISK